MSDSCTEKVLNLSAIPFDLPNKFVSSAKAAACFLYKMWSTFFLTDEDGRTVAPGTAPGVGGVAPGGPAQGAGGLAGLMSGRSTFGGNKRRRTTSGGHTMSEAQEGKVTFYINLLSSYTSKQNRSYDGEDVTFPQHSHK